jgi:hypothetical protein
MKVSNGSLVLNQATLRISLLYFICLWKDSLTTGGCNKILKLLFHHEPCNLYIQLCLSLLSIRFTPFLSLLSLTLIETVKSSFVSLIFLASLVKIKIFSDF